MNKNTTALLLLAQFTSGIKIMNDMDVNFHDVDNAGDINVYNGDDNCCDGDDHDMIDDIIEDFLHEAFLAFLADHGKSYTDTTEFDERKAAYAQTDAAIEAHNADTAHTHTLAHNHLSDATAAEKAALLGTPVGLETGAPTTTPASFVSFTNTNGVNWVTDGAVTPVKNQGACGSCWAFATTGGIEGAFFNAGNALTAFSESQFVDCDTTNGACNGGWPQTAYAYATTVDIATETAYPYVPSKETCNTGAVNAATTKVATWTSVAYSNMDALVAQLNIGPVTVVIDASGAAFGQYHSGVISSGCGTAINHAVLAVGYGTDAATGKEYYLVKNSWGTGWGDAGYVKIARTTGVGTCAIQYAPSQPLTFAP
jgi:C1A family cysteine protease